MTESLPITRRGRSGRTVIPRYPDPLSVSNRADFVYAVLWMRRPSKAESARFMHRIPPKVTPSVRHPGFTPGVHHVLDVAATECQRRTAPCAGYRRAGRRLEPTFSRRLGPNCAHARHRSSLTQSYSCQTGPSPAGQDKARPARSRATVGGVDPAAFGSRPPGGTPQALGPAVPGSSGWRARTWSALTMNAAVASFDRGVFCQCVLVTAAILLGAESEFKIPEQGIMV